MGRGRRRFRLAGEILAKCQFTLLSAGAAANATLNFYDEKGSPLPVGKQ